MIWDIRIYKSWNSRNLKAAWLNTYHVNFNGAVTDPELQEMLEAIATSERMIHLQPVQFLHATVSSMRDEPVYDPQFLKVFELQGTGNRAVVAPNQALDLNITYKVKKQVAFGRSGTMFYRGCLTSNDVLVNDRGEAQLKNDAEVASPVLFANFNNGIMNAAPNIELVMSHPSFNAADADPLAVRVVQGFNPSGVAINKRDHRYFDVKSAVAPAP